MKEITVGEAWNKASMFCAVAEHCISEVRSKLEKWGIAEEEISEIVDRLIKERFIDEERYAVSFVKDKFRYNKWGRVKIAQALWQKQIPRPVIQEAMTAIGEKEYGEVLKDLLKAKSRGLKAGTTYERNAKLVRFALGRGFEMNVITCCLNIDEDSLE